ncbi:hypothetical protein FRC10_011185 [Ceratobasidium sp. 414]|nr:hypothetical protein FRC10_011185 [Ceratobasidium sp. 414]
MFEDCCCMCGKPTTGSTACKSQDYYPNLDDTPLLVPSRAHHSLSSSPTSSVMTTLSISDDLPPQMQVQASAPFHGTASAAVAAAFARTSMPPTPGEAPRKVAGTKHGLPLNPSSIRDVNHPRAARKHHTPPLAVDVENTLHYARRSAHQRSASSSVTSLLLSPAPSTHEYTLPDEKTLRMKRKQQRASLPAYFSLLDAPLAVQDEPRLEDWAFPQPGYVKSSEYTDVVSVTPTPESRGRSRSRSRSRSRGRTFTRRFSHGTANLDTSGSVVQRGRSRVPRDLEGRAC